MRKASTRLLEQGIQTPSPALDLIPAETSTENLRVYVVLSGIMTELQPEIELLWIIHFSAGLREHCLAV
jgi:hypothetical protein